VSYQFGGHEAELEDEEEFENEARKPRRWWVPALVCITLAVTGSGAAFAWHGYGGQLLAAWPKADSAQQAAATAAAAAQDALLKGLTEGQQQASAITQQNQALLQAQAAEIKRLSDTVSQLATRVESLSVRNAQAAVAPPPAPKKPPPKVVAHKPTAPKPMSLAPEEKQ
jgi:hypothetical protein